MAEIDVMDLVGNEIIVDPKEVPWYEVPYGEYHVRMKIIEVRYPNIVPYRHHKRYGDKISFHVRGERTNGAWWQRGRIYEFWWVSGQSRIMFPVE